jgi:hypothetical protein
MTSISARLALVSVVAALGLSACASSSPTANAPSTSTAPSRASTVSVISAATRMVCGADGQEDLSSTLGAKTTRPVVARWIDNEYSCVYGYAEGTMRLAVKQLPDEPTTRRYFETLVTRLGKRQALQGLGDGAFTTTNNSVVVRKDTKVLTVDVQNLPAKFGNPADTPANVAISVAATIMGCWTEH